LKLASVISIIDKKAFFNKITNKQSSSRVFFVDAKGRWFSSIQGQAILEFFLPLFAALLVLAL